MIDIPRHDNALKFKRAELPQIASHHVGDFIKHLSEKGIGVKKHHVTPAKLKPTQSEFNLDKVKGMMGKKDLSDKPSLSSRDGYILDGHHRWLVDHNKNQSHNTVQIDLPIHDLIKHAHNYHHSFTKTITEQRKQVFYEIMRRG